MKTFESAIEVLRRLEKTGFVKTHGTGYGAVENTLKDKLGIKENFIQGPDGKQIGVRAVRKKSSRMTTLLTKSPLPRKIVTSLRDKYGYPDREYPERLVLKTSVDSVRFNTIGGKKGFMISGKTNRIELIHGTQKNNSSLPNPYWQRGEIEKCFDEKFGKSFLYVKADCRGRGSNEEFHFNEAHLLHEFDFGKLIKNLKEGMVKADLRLGLRSDGSYVDHGTVVRINPSLLDRYFSGKRV
ncbi:MvaI/BcnI family restriction endonuclease [Nitrosopumilus adriaticus]|uniref:MvaI/BcnI family restriction endonuclease n=1 Tax=Nitrosopumilus adriaticus TaxID=1580092 RepID=UPI00352F7A3E